MTVLKFMPQKGATFIYKAVESALANAQNNFDLDPSDMVLKTIFADEGGQGACGYHKFLHGSRRTDPKSGAYGAL